MNKFVFRTAAAVALAATVVAPAAPVAAKTVVMQTASPMLVAGASYTWSATVGAMVDPVSAPMANEITGARLRDAIDAGLAGRGFKAASSLDQADLTVSYGVVLDRRTDVRVHGDGAQVCGWRGCIRRWSSGPSVTSYDYTQGTLVIDLIDRRTGELLWRAASEKRVSDKDLTQKRLAELVAKMMKSLPQV